MPRPIRLDEAGPGSAMKAIAIIPARGGSQRLPNKNLSEIGGAPMLNWSIWAARDAGVDPYVTTNDLGTRETALAAGARVIDRPEWMSQGDIGTEAVMMHALSWIGDVWDVCVLLQPTSPLRHEGHVRTAVDALKEGAFDSIVSVVRDPGAAFMWDEDANGYGVPRYQARPNTQELASNYRENGAIYATTREAWQRTKKRVSGRIGLMLMEQWASIDIDTTDDLETARFWMMRQLMRRNSVYAKAAAWVQTTPPR